MEKKLAEQINESNPVDFSRKNLSIWIGQMNGKPTAYIGTRTDHVDIESKIDCENRDQAIEFITKTLEKIKGSNPNKDNLTEDDIKKIQDFFMIEKNQKLETWEIL